MDQHLFAEFREIKMVPKSLRRSIEAGGRYTSNPEAYVLRKVPLLYTLNSGHVSFFYDKGAYLFDRYNLLRHDLRRRGYNFDENALLDPDRVFASLDERFNRFYEPTPEALALVRQRIAERIALKPDWYRYTGART